MNASFASLFLLVAFACSSTPALSADASVNAARASRFNVEVKPLMLLINLVPGSRAVSAGIELPINDHIAAFGSASYLSLAINSPSRDHANYSIPADQPASSSMKDALDQSAHGGLRYYSHIASDSWYAGLGAGLHESEINWLHNNDVIADKTSMITANLEGGYRWLWNSGFLMRVGAQLTASNLRSRAIGAASASTPSPQAIDDITKEGTRKQTALSTGFDFGAGWAF